jgi:DNA-binding CsgD family transcriptional regulator
MRRARAACQAGDRSQDGRLIGQLSIREQDVLQRLLDGRFSNEIAVALEISPKAVDVHRANVMKKMGVTGGAELIRLVGPSPAFGRGSRDQASSAGNEPRSHLSPRRSRSSSERSFVV